MKNDIFNKNGFLSSYGLSCGYVQKHITRDYEVQLYREHSTYNVKNIQTSEETNRTIIFWQCYETLNEAKKKYNLIKKNIQK